MGPKILSLLFTYSASFTLAIPARSLKISSGEMWSHGRCVSRKGTVRSGSPARTENPPAALPSRPHLPPSPQGQPPACPCSVVPPCLHLSSYHSKSLSVSLSPSLYLCVSTLSPAHSPRSLPWPPLFMVTLGSLRGYRNRSVWEGGWKGEAWHKLGGGHWGQQQPDLVGAQSQVRKWVTFFQEGTRMPREDRLFPHPPQRALLASSVNSKSPKLNFLCI